MGRFDAQEWQQVPAQSADGEALGLGVAAREVAATVVVEPHAGEALGSLLELLDGGERVAQVLEAPFRVGAPEMNQLVGLCERQWPDQEGVDDAEDRHVHPDPDGQGQDDRDAETRRLEQYPSGVAKVVDQF